MNWKVRYDKFRKGDRVKMIKPCTLCSVSNEAGRNNCWERGYKNKVLVCLKDEYDTSTRGIVVNIQIGVSENWCSVTKESLVKI